LLGFCRDISEVGAPGCVFINHSNPMAMNTWACNKYGHGVQVIGLCHGVEGGHWQIAEVLGLKREEVDIICAGINHRTWYVSVKHKGKDMTGKLLKAFEAHPVFSKTERARIEMIRRFGHDVNVTGLCHGVIGGHALIAKVFGLKQEEVDIICAGINHQTWYIAIRHKGEDLTGKLLAAMEKDPEVRKAEKVRIDMLRRFGYFSTESNGHLSEYVPWYRKRVEEINDWIDTSTWIGGETGGYLRACTEGRNWFEHDFPNWMKEPPLKFGPEHRGHEHGSYIIEALETGRAYRGHFNVVNRGVITNLPPDAIVEVPGYIDGNGMNIPVVGDLPLGCAAVCNASISVQRLSVEAAMSGNDELLRQAFMMDPLTGAVLNPPEIWQMVDDMLIAGEQWLPQYKKAIAKAKRRQKSGTRIPTKDFAGAARLHTKSVEEMEKDRETATRLASASEKAGKDKRKAK